LPPKRFDRVLRVGISEPVGLGEEKIAYLSEAEDSFKDFYQCPFCPKNPYPLVSIAFCAGHLSPFFLLFDHLHHFGRGISDISITLILYCTTSP